MGLFDIDEFDDFTSENIDDINVLLNDIQQAVIWGTDWTTGTIVSQIERGLIDLKPKFQRREAWDDKRKSAFIESVILGLPIPQIILAEKKEKKGTYIVIDGKQRLISLRRFFSKRNDQEFPPLRLKGLSIIKHLNGKSFEEISEDTELESFSTQIENYPIRTIVIKNWPNEEFLYNVFLRLNTGSLPLAPQELRQALHPGNFIDFTDEFSISSEQIKKVLSINKPDYRMRDIELVIRYFSFKYFIKDYNGNLKSFFDKTVELLNSNWEQQCNKINHTAQQLNEAIDATFIIFGSNAFSKWKNKSFDSRFNRAIFDIMVYYFSIPEVRDIAITKQEEIKSEFKTLCETNIEFLNSFETSTKNVLPTNTRFNTWGTSLARICNLKIDIPNLL